ncbi:Auxin responsive SAUR protein, partial [Cynara cardunculus var. scolymus]
MGGLTFPCKEETFIELINNSQGTLAHCLQQLQFRGKFRFIVPLAYVKHPSFQDLMNLYQEEFGYSHPMGGLTFPCIEDTFIELTRDIDLTS